MTLLLQILVTFGVLSLVAVGGANAVLPEMHRQLVELRGWLDDATFTQLYALAQAAPGPNILVASVMGWRIGGAGGMAMATVGMLLPAAALAWDTCSASTRAASARSEAKPPARRASSAVWSFCWQMAASLARSSVTSR